MPHIGGLGCCCPRCLTGFLLARFLSLTTLLAGPNLCGRMTNQLHQTYPLAILRALAHVSSEQSESGVQSLPEWWQLPPALATGDKYKQAGATTPAASTTTLACSHTSRGYLPLAQSEHLQALIRQQRCRLEDEPFLGSLNTLH